MAAGWLYKVDSTGVLVTPEFMQRLRSGDAAALRALNKQNLTMLYRQSFTRQSRRPDAEGLFWSSAPALDLIPFIRAGRHPASAWVRDGQLAVLKGGSDRAVRRALAFVRTVRKSQTREERKLKLPPSQNTFAKVSSGNTVEAWYMKANPKFELVVINKHDRGTLLKLLSELDASANVAHWLAERTERGGATRSTPLFEDYQAWCERQGETPAGKKTFAQALVAEGVAKLERSAAGERYALALRPA